MVGSTSGVIFEQNGDNIDMTILQGKTINFTVIWGGGTPINVTGFDAKMQLRKSVSDEEPVVEFSVSNSRVTIGTTNGQINFSMTAADSAALEPSQGVYDIEVTDASGNVYQVQSGRYNILQSVTR